MKQILLIIFSLAFIFVNAQEIDKNNQAALESNEMLVLELKAPLNLFQCENCILENPVIDLEEINNDVDFIANYESTFGNQFLAINFLINQYGIIEQVSINKTFNSNLWNSESKNEWTLLINKFLKKRLFKNYFNSNYKIKTTISMLVIDNNLVLNPLIHN